MSRMDYFLKQVRYQMPPVARGIALLAGVAAILVCDNFIVLAGVLGLVVLPMLIASGALKLYGRFLVFMLAPIGLALFIVWGMVVEASPGQPLGSSPTEGMIFAVLITLRIALLSGLFQAFFGGVRGDKLVTSLASWGITGDLRVIILATFAMVPEGKLRADQVLTSRLARGLVKRRSWVSNGFQIPHLLRPMFGWTLRSAIERAELWDHRHLLEKLQSNGELETCSTTTTWPHQVEAIDSVITGPVMSFAQIVGKIGPGKIMALVGPNFSGRTRFLRTLSGLKHSGAEEGASHFDFSGGAYVGPEAHTSMSGLTQTVEEELTLHVGGKVENSSVFALVDALRLKALASRNPVTLSGGEQACVALSCALAMNPKIMAIDCAFEQLDRGLRSEFLAWLSAHGSNCPASIIADNRFDELGLEEQKAFSSIESINGQLEAGVNDTLDRSFASISSDGFKYQLSSSPFDLDVDQISFSYDSSHDVLHDVCMRLSPGNLYVLEGANGSGKSTLARLICGVLKKSAGQFYRNGKAYHPWDMPGRHVAYHFQNPDVQLFATTVLEEVTTGACAHDFRPADARRYARHLLEHFGLIGLADHHPLDLPFVLRKRVAMAATLASGCPWVILDEPTLGQDQKSCNGIRQMIEEAQASGVGFIIISHSISFRECLTNPVTFAIDGGSVRITGNSP